MPARFALKEGRSLRASWWNTLNSKSVYAIGRNYVAHANELSNPVPKKPFWFLKPVSSIIGPGETHRLFPGAAETHHEVELGIVIGRTCKNVSPEDAGSYISGFFLGLDMTDRAGQDVVKKEGKPWTQAKGWETSLPVSDLVLLEDVDAALSASEESGDENKLRLLSDLGLWLKVNDEERQRGTTADMIFNIGQQMAAVSRVHRLDPGDIILTGTPEGVGACVPGDVITAGIDGCDGLLDIRVPVDVGE